MPEIVDKRRRTNIILDVELIDREDVSVFAKMVYTVLIRYEGKDKISWPGIETISRKAGITHPTAEKAIKELESLQIIGVKRRRGSSNQYLLLDKALWKTDQTTKRGCVVEDQTTKRGCVVEDQTTKRGCVVEDQTTKRGCVEVLKAFKDTHTTAPGGAFVRFWSGYPSKGKKHKLDAQKAWRELKPNEGLVEKIMAALEEQRKTDMWKRGIGIPYAASWLRGQRWTDEVDLAVDSTDGPMEMYIAIGEEIKVNGKRQVIPPAEIARRYGLDLRLCHITFDQDCADLRAKGIDPSRFIILRHRPDGNYTIPTQRGIVT